MIVLPKWVTQLGVIFGGIALGIEALQQAGVFALLPSAITLTVVAVGGVAASLGAALGDHDSDGIINILDPDYRNRGGFTTPRLLGLLVLVGIVSLAVTSCVRKASATAPALAWKVERFADDSTVATAQCGDAAWRTATAVSTCEWQVTRQGTAVTVAPGFSARLVFVGAPGASTNYVASARGKNPVGQTGPWSANSTSPAVTIGYPPITAPTITWSVVPL